MDRITYLPFAPIKTGKKGKRTAYLIAVRHKREALRVYAVVAPSAEAALAQVKGLMADRMDAEVVGALSRDLIEVSVSNRVRCASFERADASTG